MELLQVASEIEPVLDIYRSVAPERVLEIGCWDGGTLKLWLENAAKGATIVAVDLEHRNSDAYSEWVRDDVTLNFYVGDSQGPAMARIIEMNGLYDWVFIDGDHGYGAVRTDLNNCLPYVREGGCILLHDIEPPAGLENYPPGVLLEEYRAMGYRVETFVEKNQDPWAHGIGLIHV